MAIKKGIVEFFGKNKFDKSKASLKLEGDNNWYSQPFEWLEVQPEKGDEVEFDDGGRKYIRSLTIVSKGAGGGQRKGWQQRSEQRSDVNPAEVGQCINLAVSLGMVKSYNDFTPDVIEGCVARYKQLKAAFTKAFEGKPQQQETQQEDFDDDIPF